VKEYEIPILGMCEGDCKIQLLVKQGKKLTKVCHFWFNTGFVEELELNLAKPVIDVANKDKKCKVFKNNFTIHAFFRKWDPKDEKEEEKFNNVRRQNITKQATVPKPEKQEEEHGVDTESSFDLKAGIDDDQDDKKKPDNKIEEKKRKK